MKKVNFFKSNISLPNKKSFLFLIITIGIVCAGVFAYKLLTTRPDYVIVRIKGSPGNWWWVTPRPPDWLAEAVHKGDKEYNSLGVPTAEVLTTNIYDAGGSNKDVYITVKLSARKNSRTNKYRYKGESLEIGGPIVLQLNQAFFPGMVTKITPGEIPPQRKELTKRLRVKIEDTWSWVFDSFNPKDVMTDGDGKNIATIIDKSMEPAIKEVETSQGMINQALSPIKKDIYVTLDLVVENRSGDFVFREEQYIKVGNRVWIQFPNYNFNGAEILTITDTL